MSLMSVRLGTDDVERARRFYDATFLALGFGDIAVSLPVPAALYQLPGGIGLLLGGARDGQPASVGNGDTLGFSAPDAAAVDRWHAAGLAQGGTCEGAPGPREAAGRRYGAYLRDPDWHKLCAYAPG